LDVIAQWYMKANAMAHYHLLIMVGIAAILVFSAMCETLLLFATFVMSATLPRVLMFALELLVAAAATTTLLTDRDPPWGPQVETVTIFTIAVVERMILVTVVPDLRPR
jgi:hypothetical protein